ncbi:hypothetical protein FM113_02855 [Leucobacter sp. 7(1)]|nr:hypothetical protein FM113_02855 [Leucobacter sp. 7(1)]
MADPALHSISGAAQDPQPFPAAFCSAPLDAIPRPSTPLPAGALVSSMCNRHR